MKKCPECGAKQEGANAASCPKCNALLGSGKSSKRKKRKEPKYLKKEEKKAKPGKKAKKKHPQKPIQEPQQPADDGYDGYYDDVLPPDMDRISEGIDKELVKKIVILITAVAFAIGICIAMLYFL